MTPTARAALDALVDDLFACGCGAIGYVAPLGSFSRQAHEPWCKTLQREWARPKILAALVSQAAETRAATIQECCAVFCDECRAGTPAGMSGVALVHTDSNGFYRGHCRASAIRVDTAPAAPEAGKPHEGGE